MEKSHRYKIGVDARLLSEPHTGIGRYLFEVLSRLVDMGHDWFLYSHRPLMSGDWLYKKNVVVKTCTFQSRVMRMIWAQSILPLWAKLDNIDIFWGPSHRIPYILENRVAVVLTIHDLVWLHAGGTMRPLSRYMDSRLMPYAITRADRIITVSKHTAKDVENEFPNSSDKVRPIHLGGNISTIHDPSVSLSTLGIKNDYFLFVGTIEPRKNLQRLIEALTRIPSSELGAVKLVIVGGKGWGGIDVAALVTQYKIQNSVLVLGYVTDEVLNILYKSALFLVMPSLYEGFGLPLLEALSIGTPVLTSNCSSMPEVVGDAAILVDPYSVDSIKMGIQALLNSPELRSKLSEMGIKQSTLFSWDNAAVSTLKVFQEAIKSRRIGIKTKFPGSLI